MVSPTCFWVLVIPPARVHRPQQEVGNFDAEVLRTVSAFGLRLRHVAQRKRFPFTAVFGRTFFPFLRKFFAIEASLHRQLPDEFHRPLNPVVQLVFHDAFRLDQYPVLHRPASNVERFDVRLPHCIFAFIETEPGDQRVFPDTYEVVPVQEEGDAAEHLLFFDVFPSCQSVTDALSKGFIEGRRFVSSSVTNALAI
jgi:hypothetical protein